MGSFLMSLIRALWNFGSASDLLVLQTAEKASGNRDSDRSGDRRPPADDLPSEPKPRSPEKARPAIVASELAI